MRVINIDDSAEYRCGKCHSWLEHWCKFTGQDVPRYCAVKNCYNPPEVGAHVDKSDPWDAFYYIVPLCCKHSQYQGELDLESGTRLAVVERCFSCG